MLPFIIVLVVLAIAMLVITQPLRRAPARSAERAAAAPPATTIAELEAAREAKYAEIREAELDHQMGKLGDDDFEAVDRALRAEAIEILAALDAARPATPEVPPPSTISER